MNAFQFSLIIIIYILSVIVGGYYLLKKPEQPQQVQQKPMLDLTYEQAINILDYAISTTISVKLKDYRLRDVKMPYDFKKEQTEIVQNVMRQLTPEFMAVLMQYHPRTEIIRRVSRSAGDFLIEYIRKYKVKTK